MERRGHDLAVPLVQSGMQAIPAAIAARLMEGARRDVTSSPERRRGSFGESGVIGGTAADPRRQGSPTSHREHDFHAATSVVAPWKVAQRPDGRGGGSPSRRNREDPDEDEDALLARFGLSHRDEVSLRAVHLKKGSGPPAAKYDIRKRAPAHLVIGKPGARAATPDPAGAAAPARDTVLDAGRPRRGPLPSRSGVLSAPLGPPTPPLHQPSASSLPGSRVGSAGPKHTLQQLSDAA
jgi:hypothetical protein